MEILKRLSFISMMFLCITSCDTEAYSDYIFQESENAGQTSNSPKTWKEQLKFAQNLGKVTRLNDKGIRLLDYQHIGTIETTKDLENVILRIFSEDSYIVQYTDSLTFDVISIKESKERAVSSSSLLNLEWMKSKLLSMVTVGMEIVDLEWTYGDRTIHSTAIVSDAAGGVVFDAIGYFLISSNDGKKEKVARKMIKRTKSASEVDADVTVPFEISNEITNLYGMKVAEYSITCKSYFKDDILVDRKLNAHYYHAPLWDCHADIRTLNGTIDESSYHEFAWGYVYGVGTVELSFGKLGFTFTGADTGDAGTEVHRP